MKLTTTKTPKLNAHKFIVTLTNGKKTKFHYLTSPIEIKALKKKIKKGNILSVYKAMHTPVGAWTA